MIPGNFNLSPLLVGPANCPAALGVSWRWLRDHSTALGLTILTIDGKSFIDAQAARDAITVHGVPTPADESLDDLAQLRARLGKRKAS